MSENRITLGIARLGGKLFSAEVDHQSGRPEVKSFFTSNDTFDKKMFGRGRLFFNVDQRLAVVRKIRIQPSSPVKAAELIRFEMSQSLLEPPDRFYFDFLPIDDENGFRRFISIAYHLREIDRQIEAYTSHLQKPSGFKLDAIALSSGYLTFCRQEGGEFHILANIESDSVAMAVLYKQKIRLISRPEINPGQSIDDERAKVIAAEFRIIIDFLLAELFEEGLTIPLSRMILSGEHASNQPLRKALSDQLKIEIARPRFNEGYFKHTDKVPDDNAAERFLIPLGLATG